MRHPSWNAFDGEWDGVGPADLTGTAGSDTVTIAIKQVTRSFWFPGACNSYVYTLP